MSCGRSQRRYHSACETGCHSGCPHAVQSAHSYDKPIQQSRQKSKEERFYEGMMASSKSSVGGLSTDYGDIVARSVLDPSIFENQRRYASDMNNSTSGASTLSERSDPNDVVSWQGLRRPRYNAVYPGDDARVDISESPSQMPSRETPFVLS